MQVAPVLAVPGTRGGSNTALSENAPMGSTAADSEQDVKESELHSEQQRKTTEQNELAKRRTKYEI